MAPLLAVGVAQVWQSPKQCHFLRLEPFEVIEMVNIYQVRHLPCNIQLMEETSNNHLGYINLVNNKINYNLRIQICPKKGIYPVHSYSLRMGLESYISYSIREGSGFLGTSYKHVVNGVKTPINGRMGTLGYFTPISGVEHVMFYDFWEKKKRHRYNPGMERTYIWDVAERKFGSMNNSSIPRKKTTQKMIKHLHGCFQK